MSSFPVACLKPLGSNSIICARRENDSTFPAADTLRTIVIRGLEKEHGVRKVLLTTSCTAALEMIGILLDGRPGDEVNLPSFAFVSVASAFILRSAKPVFVDIRPDTLNIDADLVNAHFTERTKAIVAVHYNGAT